MSSLDRQNRVKSLFADALDLEPASRDSFLESAASDDPTICFDVRQLIAAHGRAGGFLVDPSIDESDAVRPVGETIGQYTLLRLIGEGGFGSVYLAQQHEPIARQVAIKIIKLGMDTRQVIARFEGERRVLAMMKHPGIAAVFDAGTIKDGRPYFVMELVEGVAITDYCDQRCLPIEARLKLFIQVCEAVQHAHTKGVIHRDIKPSNLLVTVNGEAPLPKVIDFGIAKAAADPLTDVTVSVDGRAWLGTPQYMSPEQAGANASDIDTRADVYSLGAVLYELLAGATPFEERSLRAAGGEWQRIIREQEPPRPSTKSATLSTLSEVAARRSLEPQRLPTRLRGDLDWITLKALEKDRERRYHSAAELAEDLRRHLNHEPVLASPPGRTYRLKKFVRRHRIGVAASSIATLAVIAGAVSATLGMVQAQDAARRAQEAAHDVTAVSDFMRQVLTSAEPAQQGADVRLVDVLGDASVAATIQFADRPLLEAEVRDLLSDVYSQLSMWRAAEDEARRALTLWQEHVGLDDPRTLRSWVKVGQNLVNQERGRDADRFLEGLLPRLHRLFGADHAETIEGEGVVAGMLHLRGRLDESEQMLRQALEKAEAVDADLVLRLRLLNSLTGTLRDKITNNAERETDLQACAESAQRLLTEGVRAGEEGIWFAFAARSILAELAQQRGQFADAAAQAQQLLADSQARMSECHIYRVHAMRVIAECEYALGHPQEAADLYLQLIACNRAEFGSTPRLVISLTDGLYHLYKGDRWAEGEACAREALQIILQDSSPGHPTAYFYETYVAHFISLQRRHEEAEPLYQSLLARYDQASAQEQASLDFCYAGHLIRGGRFEEAEQHLKRLIPTLDPKGTYDDDSLMEFIALYDAWGRPEKADEYRALRAQPIDLR